jgi:hypothetical protein
MGIMVLKTAYNTRFIQFGLKYKAFAKVVPSGRTIIYALQMAKKTFSFVSSISVDSVSKPHFW